MNNKTFVEKLLKLLAKNNLSYALVWDEDLNFFFDCNDVIVPTSDYEPIKTEEDLELLKKCIEDTPREYYDLSIMLYCCRRRKVKPRESYYNFIGDNLKELFDQAAEQ